jgi:hypothetical protein
MFGRMSVDAILSVERGCEPLAAVRSLVELSGRDKHQKMHRVPGFNPVFAMIPGDSTSGAVYVLDRKSGVWYWIDFEDNQYGGYSQEELEELLSKYNLLSLVERPALLRSGLKWVVEPSRISAATNRSAEYPTWPLS